MTMLSVDGILAALMPRKLVSGPELRVDQDCARAEGNATARKSKMNTLERVRSRMARL
jgi:hypothetical protein